MEPKELRPIAPNKMAYGPFWVIELEPVGEGKHRLHLNYRLGTERFGHILASRSEPPMNLAEFTAFCERFVVEHLAVFERLEASFEAAKREI